jgi:hypothetical protein
MATKLCPLLKKECIEHQCEWFTHVLGNDPQTGKPLDHWNCAVPWLPMLLIDGTQQGRQTGAAIESFRNEMVRANKEINTNSLIAANNQKKITGEST